MHMRTYERLAVISCMWPIAASVETLAGQVTFCILRFMESTTTILRRNCSDEATTVSHLKNYIWPFWDLWTEMSTNLSINYVLSIRAKIPTKNPCIENTGIFA